MEGHKIEEAFGFIECFLLMARSFPRAHKYLRCYDVKNLSLRVVGNI